MRGKIFSIWSVLLVLVVSIAVLVPGCGETTPTQCTIEVKATLDGSSWSGAVQYTLTGPGAASPITGTNVSDTFTVDPGSWTCAYVSGGPPAAYFVNITPNPTQSVSAGGTITFTLNFETPIGIDFAIKDAGVGEYAPDTNYGNASEMLVAPWDPYPAAGWKHRAFVWFSLASLPAGAQVQSATLYLYHSVCYGSGIHTNGAYRVTDVWEEMIITWNNQPPSASNSTDDITFDICDTGKWRSWDVTPDIDAIAIETGWVSWVIKHIDEDVHEAATLAYTTKEGGVAPYLKITYLP